MCKRMVGLPTIRCLSRNQAAKKFWKRVIDSSPEASDLREIDAQTERWTGPVFRFEWLAG